MCYSAMVEQRFKEWLRWQKVQARIDTALFEELFQRRMSDDSLRIAKALEENFSEPTTAQEERVKHTIDAYHAKKTAVWETEVFTQRKRLADATRSLTVRETKKAREEQRIASGKIERALQRLADLKRTTLEPNDSRIYPFWYAPVMVWEKDGYVIKPMRYHCRLARAPASSDTRYPGLYNARRDNLEKYWKDVFGRHHAIVMATSFFENVARHDYERRALRPDEQLQNIVLQFNPRPPRSMLLACLWDRWQSGSEDLYSFAVITDDPPPEVAQTGHNRCPIPLRPENIEGWLRPECSDVHTWQRILDERERPYYEHARAA